MQLSRSKANPFANDNQGGPNVFLHLVGYTLLVLAFIDIANILIPPQFMDPAWELQAIGTLVERIPAPLIGFALIFYGGVAQRRKWEQWSLKPLAIVAIVWGICFLLMIPLGIADSLRIHQKNTLQLTADASLQAVRLNQLELEVNKAPETDLRQLAQRLRLELPSSGASDPNPLRAEVLAQIDQSRSRGKAQLKAMAKEQQQALIKKTVRWLLGALISGFSLIYMGYLMQKSLKFRGGRP